MNSHRADLLAGVLERLRETIPGSPVLAADTELLDSGLLDSLGIVSVTSALEADHGVEFPPVALRPETFTDPNALTDALVEALATRPRRGERHPTAP
ncbi:phosphopantetheine-binding protein [Streptomyces sp. NPDC093510]|uniref:phosphopantetheine-binding protein n=1 Tax=Streptomyces sp. NPDC093510 TaxID=3155199 RepID=UPI0034468CFA